MEKLTIEQLKELSGFLVELNGIYSWQYQFPFKPINNEIEFITVSLN